MAGEHQDDLHHFEFDLDRGIRDQVVEKLEASPLLPLKKGIGPDASGICTLYYHGRLAYLGMVSKSTTKSKRLCGIGSMNTQTKSRVAPAYLDAMQCRFLTFESDWWVFAAELALITHYKPDCNATGFGSKVPGKGRPGTERISRWDKLFPKKPPKS